MENSFQTSFIPKKPIATITPIATNRTVGLFTVFSLIVLVLASILSIGLYFYKSYLTNKKVDLSASLLRVRDNFEQNTIDELELFDKRTSVAKQVLSSHIVLSPLFSLIDSLTLPSIQYTSFSHQTVDKVFSVKMSGLASDYKSVALQANAFNGTKGRYLKNIVFSNLNKDKNNQVSFDLEFTVDPALLSYDKNVLLEQAQGNSGTSDQTQHQNTVPVINPIPKVVPNTVTQEIVVPPAVSTPKTSPSKPTQTVTTPTPTTTPTTAPQQQTAPAPIKTAPSTTTPPPPPLPPNAKTQ